MTPWLKQDTMLSRDLVFTLQLPWIRHLGCHGSSYHPFIEAILFMIYYSHSLNVMFPGKLRFRMLVRTQR